MRRAENSMDHRAAHPPAHRNRARRELDYFHKFAVGAVSAPALSNDEQPMEAPHETGDRAVRFGGRASNQSRGAVAKRCKAFGMKVFQGDLLGRDLYCRRGATRRGFERLSDTSGHLGAVGFRRLCSGVLVLVTANHAVVFSGIGLFGIVPRVGAQNTKGSVNWEPSEKLELKPYLPAGSLLFHCFLLATTDLFCRRFFFRLWRKFSGNL